jgi:hypothetical protein
VRRKSAKEPLFLQDLRAQEKRITSKEGMRAVGRPVVPNGRERKGLPEGLVRLSHQFHERAGGGTKVPYSPA